MVLECRVLGFRIYGVRVQGFGLYFLSCMSSLSCSRSKNCCYRALVYVANDLHCD